MITDNGLLYIEPRERPSERPVIDELTRQMTALDSGLAEPTPTELKDPA